MDKNGLPAPIGMYPYKGDVATWEGCLWQDPEEPRILTLDHIDRMFGTKVQDHCPGMAPKWTVVWPPGKWKADPKSYKPHPKNLSSNSLNFSKISPTLEVEDRGTPDAILRVKYLKNVSECVEGGPPSRGRRGPSRPQRGPADCKMYAKQKKEQKILPKQQKKSRHRSRAQGRIPDYNRALTKKNVPGRIRIGDLQN